MTPKETFIAEGCVIFPEAIPMDLVARSVDEINAKPDECFAWETPVAEEFRNWLRGFLDSQNLDLHGDGIRLSTFNRPVGGSMYWHDDEDGSNTNRVFINCYLTDTREGRGALKIIPKSHLGGNDHLRVAVRKMRLEVSHIPPYQNYTGDPQVDHPELYTPHPDEQIVGVPAGTVFVGDRRVLHAVTENIGPNRRTMALWWQFMQM